MKKKLSMHNRINFQLLSILIALSIIMGVIISGINMLLLRGIYERSFQDKVFRSNAMMASFIQESEVKYFVDLMTNQNEAFKQRQRQFAEDREQLAELEANGASQAERDKVITMMQTFHDIMYDFKNESYRQTLDNLKQLRDASGAKYAYIFADTGVTTADGTKLYTYIFDAEDNDSYDRPDCDGLGTVSFFDDIADKIYQTGKGMDTVFYYNALPYGELYYAYAPILDTNGNVVAIMGTDVELGEMHSQLNRSLLLTNTMHIIFSLLIILAIYFFMTISVIKPVTQITSTAMELARGNISANVPNRVLHRKSELGLLAKAVTETGQVYEDMITSTHTIFTAANSGQLDLRNDPVRFRGDIATVIRQFNATLDATVMYLNSIPESICILDDDLNICFQNNVFASTYPNISGKEFICKVFSADEGETDQVLCKYVNDLIDSGRNQIFWQNQKCFSVIFRTYDSSETQTVKTNLVIAVNITDLMNEKEKAQTAAVAKSNFLSRMSHEMRTPMNAIIGMSEVASNTDDMTCIKKCLETISASSGQLLNTINDVLDMSKIEAGKLELEHIPFSLRGTVGKIHTVISNSALSKNQNLVFNIPNELYDSFIGDPMHLSQILTNLLSNAIKFTPESGSITLTINELESGAGNSLLQFTVTDTGVGLTKEQIGRLFSAFEQADGGTARKFGGTGLGLVISKSLVEKMGGNISVESVYGEGSTFAFVIPLPWADAKAMPTPDDSMNDPEFVTPDFSHVNLLIAEDVEINRMVINALLEATGIHIEFAENGQDAVAKFIELQDKLDLILMDVQMPEMDGYDATRKIRSLDGERAATIPIIAQTANAFKDDVDMALNCGMNDHISKPIEFERLCRTIQKYVAK